MSNVQDTLAWSKHFLPSTFRNSSNLAAWWILHSHVNVMDPVECRRWSRRSLLLLQIAHHAVTVKCNSLKICGDLHDMSICLFTICEKGISQTWEVCGWFSSGHSEIHGEVVWCFSGIPPVIWRFASLRDESSHSCHVEVCLSWHPSGPWDGLVLWDCCSSSFAQCPDCSIETVETWTWYKWLFWVFRLPYRWPTGTDWSTFHV